jgi:hypothetical protein
MYMSSQTSLPELLTSLPETVVTSNGQVVHVRAAIRNHVVNEQNMREEQTSLVQQEQQQRREHATLLSAPDQYNGGTRSGGTTGAGRSADERSTRIQNSAVNNSNTNSLLQPRQQLVKLRIKSDSGNRAILVELDEHTTIGDVKRIVAARRTLDSQFQLRATFPFPRSFDDDNLTLLDAGLAPSATLMVQSALLTA